MLDTHAVRVARKISEGMAVGGMPKYSVKLHLPDKLSHEKV